MSVEVRFLDFNYPFQSNVSITSATEDASFPASNLGSFLRSKVFRTTAVADQSAVIDLKSTEAIDSVALVFDAIGGVKLTTSAVIKIQASATNVWTSPPVDITMTLDEVNANAIHLFASDENYRYWRINIDDPTNGFGYIEFPKILLCKATILTKTIDVGFEYPIRDNSSIQINNYGQRYADVVPNRRGFGFNWGVMEQADIETLMQMYERLGNVTPLGMMIDSQETLFADRNRFFIYGYFVGSINAKHRQMTYFDQELAIEEAF